MISSANDEATRTLVVQEGVVMYPSLLSNPRTKRPCVSCGSFPVGLAADRSRNLTLDILFLAIDNEQQRRVHSYTSEIE